MQSSRGHVCALSQDVIDRVRACAFACSSTVTVRISCGTLSSHRLHQPSAHSMSSRAFLSGVSTRWYDHGEGAQALLLPGAFSEHNPAPRFH